MEIRAKVALSLPNKYYKITLKYDTFQKATWDEYLVANLVASSTKREAMKYIDEISGNGSLNSHFKKLYDKISDLKKKQVNDILQDSLFPVTMIDTKHHFKYYPMFDATRMENRVYKGNIKNNEDLIKYLIMPPGDNIKFLGLEYSEEEGKLKQDTYNAIFSDDEIMVDLDGGNYYPISKENFKEVYKSDLDNNWEGYLGEIGNTITEGNWSVLSKSIVNNFKNSKWKYRDSSNFHTELTNELIKTFEIISVFGMYFYKVSGFEFKKENAKQCEDAINYLMQSNNINEFKNKSLINLLSAVDDKLSQSVINYILSRKDSKELSEFGMKLIKSGLEKGWDLETLLSMKKSVSFSEFNYLYKLNPNLGFNIEEILNIDDMYLIEEHKRMKTDYLSEKENIIREINLMIGEITNSGLREKIKSLGKSDLKDKVKKFLDKRTGHNTKEYTSLTLPQLKKEYEEIKDMYTGKYQELLKLVEENK